MVTLVKMARDIYPHDHLGDGYYAKAVEAYDGKAAPTPPSSADREGVADWMPRPRPSTDAPTPPSAWEDDRVAVLQRDRDDPVLPEDPRRHGRRALQPEGVWPKFGYEGSSAEHGGYIASRLRRHRLAAKA